MDQPRRARNVPTADPGVNIFGDDSLRSPEGRGVVGGRPYGEQLDTERRETAAMHKFNPSGLARLRAATRRALGRP